MLPNRGLLNVPRLSQVPARRNGRVNKQAVNHVELQIEGALAPMVRALMVVLLSLHPQLFMLKLTETSMACLLGSRWSCRLPSTQSFAVASSKVGGRRRTITRGTVQEMARHDSWRRVARARVVQLWRVT